MYNAALMLTAQTQSRGDGAVVRNPVISDGLILNRTSAGGFVLHAATPSGVRELGCFDRVEDAWKAVDALDREA